MTDLVSFLKIIIFSLSNCHICDNQGLVVITAGKWSFWRTLDGKYLYLCLIPLTNCICISSRQEEGLWLGRVKGAGREVPLDTPYKLYLYLIQTGRGVVAWEGKRSREGGREGGYHRNFLCNGLITYSSSGSCFCKRPSCKINMNNNNNIIIMNTILTTTNQMKLMQVGFRMLCGIGASVGPHDMTI